MVAVAVELPATAMVLGCLLFRTVGGVDGSEIKKHIPVVCIQVCSRFDLQKSFADSFAFHHKDLLHIRWDKIVAHHHNNLVVVIQLAGLLLELEHLEQLEIEIQLRRRYSCHQNVAVDKQAVGKEIADTDSYNMDSMDMVENVLAR